MSSVVLNGDTSGAVTLAVPAVAGTNTVTIAAQTGTLNAAGPAFSAYQGSAQALSAGVMTKILFDTEEFDTNNNFASSRFTPTVAGYYQLNARFRVSTSLANAGLSIYKNGSAYKDGVYVDNNSVGVQVSSLVYLNGTTDYVEIYGYFSNSQNTTAGQSATWFNGCLMRGA